MDSQHQRGGARQSCGGAEVEAETLGRLRGKNKAARSQSEQAPMALRIVRLLTPLLNQMNVPFKQARGTIRRTTSILLLTLLLCAAARAQTLKLESGWQFLPDRTGALTVGSVAGAEGWRAAKVGLSWNAQFADLRDYMGIAWYRTRLDAPPLDGGKRALLKFGAVDYFSEVFVNGQKVGEHEGGYTPFGFDVTDKLKPGANEMLVRVVDPPMDEKENRARFPQMLYKEIPHGKQNWYVQTGGIWQPVWFEIKQQIYITGVRVTAQNTGRLDVFVGTSSFLPVAGPTGPAQHHASPYAHAQNTLDLKARVIDPSGKAFDLHLVGGNKDGMRLAGQVPNPLLWDIHKPNLYTIDVTLKDDRVTDRFGFRSFEARDGKFYLNGEPFYMMAALDQDFYPETIYTAPSEDYIRDQMLKAKQLGLNMLRCHIKVCEPAYLKVADEVGMLVWYEIPSWNDFNHFSMKAAERGERVFREMTERDWNHPSIVIQSVINESWGADLKQADQRQWLRAAFERAKKLVAPRGILVVDNSPCCDNFHLKTDIDDFHRYNSIPDYHAEFDRWVADFATRPRWSFSPHGDAERTGAEPLVVSEFGNWGLPKLPKDLPWWFARDFGGREVTRPAGVHERFKEFGFTTLFRDYDALAEATQWHQFRSLKHEIEEIRRHSTIQGYVITEFTDINWEVNGLLDMWRNPKVYAAELAKIQQPDVVMLRPAKRNYTGGERVELAALVSHYGDKELNGAQISWSTESGAKGSFKIGQLIKRAGVEALPPISFDAPATERPRRERVLIEVRGKDDSLVAENSAEVFIYPKPAPAQDIQIVIHDPGNQLKFKEAITAAGYRVLQSGANPERGHLLIAPALDAVVERHLQNGGRAIILANAKDALPADALFRVAPRAGDWDGNWVTNFNWVRTDAAPFSEVAIGPLLGFEGVNVIPQFIIQGVAGAAYAGEVLSGIFYGWLNNNAALAVQMKAGNGKLLLTTYRFNEYGRDPYATWLLDAMIRHAASPAFAPRLEWRR